MLLPVACSACPFPWYALSNPNPSRILARPCSSAPLIPITMAKARRYGLIPQLDIEQIVLEAQHRWLRPAEICEILRNHQKFHITTEPPIKPLSGSLFLFDRKVLRYFRKDGHIWRKKKDGKTVKEAHERLKDGSVDVLHCYYAHGEENEDFQRRSYWMLEEELMHIVLVHYLEVKGNRASYSHAREPEELAQVASMVSPVCSNFFTNQSFLPSWTAEAESTNSTKMSKYEDAESDNYQTSSRYNSFPELQEYDGSVKEMHISNPYVSLPYPNNQCNYQRLRETTPVSNFDSQEDFTNVIDETGLAISFGVSRTQSDLTALDEVLARYNTGSQSASFQASCGSSIQAANLDGNNKRDALTFGDLFVDDLSLKKKDAATGEGKPMCTLSDAEVGSLEIPNANVKSDQLLEGNINYALPLLELCNIEREEGLQKHDSFSRWMSKELGEVVDLQMNAGAGFDLSAFQSGTVEDSSIPNQERDTYLLSTSLSQDQLFSIIDFSPNWAYTGLKTKVLITGTFLRSKEDVCKCKWSCMFGEVEVPAEILADGTLRCHSPPHRPGRVPFYITCSNRLACSEVQEFEYRVSPPHNVETSDPYSRITKEIYLHIRFERLLSLGSTRHSESISSGGNTTSDICSKISSLMMEADDDWYNLLQLTCDIEISQEIVKDMLLEKLLKEKLHDWLLHNVAEAEDSKGLCVLDKDGQGVLHLAAALGYDWAIRPIITAGVSVNFRDVRGWTALHWAAFCGRERTIIALIAVGAAPGALTDPTPVFPSGQTPADLASENRHKGIAGFLAESSLTKHLTFLTLKEFECGDVADFPSVLGDNIVAERSIIQLADGDTQEGVSLKDSLNAVRNAAQAAARIYQAFRVQSFQRKQVVEYGASKCRISEECALSLASVKHAKPGQHDMPVHAAAIRIQKKFRGWKGRKDFLIIRQRVVKIQAHFRGHQVRKHYKKIVWSVGIVEKVILRWRRKGSGLRGFRPERLLEGPTMQNQSSKQDDYDFLREGRKQTEAGLEKALARVKSMVQYPEARDQYRRLLTDVTELQQFKLMQDSKTSASTEADHGDFMLELEGIWEDDTLVPAK